MNLDNQHYNMAAMLARYWNYEKCDSTNNRKRLIAVFDIDKFFESEDQNFFIKIKDDNYLKQKIKEAISSEDPKNQKNNKRADAIFTSMLISKETEKKLDVYNIEKSFLSLLEKSKNFSINVPDSMQIIRNFTILQIIRSPAKYKFLLDGYFNKNIGLAINKDKRIPNLFNTFSLLDFTRIENFLSFANEQIIEMYNDFNDKIKDFVFYPIEIKTNFIGDLTASYLNLRSFGLNDEQIRIYFPQYIDNENYFCNSLYIPITNNKILIGVKQELISTPHEKEKHIKLITDLFDKSFMNQIQIIYSRYIAFPPQDKELFLSNTFNFFKSNNLEYFYLRREANIGYLNSLEMLLEKFKKIKDRNLDLSLLDENI